MSRIPHKKSRPIVVAGRRFRWLLNGSARFIGNTPEVFHLTIQEDVEKPGGVLQVMLVSKALDNGNVIDDNNPTHKATVYVRDVERLICTALEMGWDTSLHGIFSDVGELELQEYRVSRA